MPLDADTIGDVLDLHGEGKTLEEIAEGSGLDIGDVQTVLAGAMVSGARRATAGPPPPTPVLGGLRVVKFDFAHDTPDRDTGVVVFTPEVGDQLYDAWFDVHTAFNGTTPLADIGTDDLFANSFDAEGLFAFIAYNGACRLDADEVGGDWLGSSDFAGQNQGFENGPLGGQHWVWNTAGADVQNLTPQRTLPLRFLTTNPLKLVANQTGNVGGAADGSTAGSATLYLAVASPVTA